MKKTLLLTLAILPSLSFAGEVTYAQWNNLYNRLEITYFDTAGSKAICTVFYKNKPVGASSAILYNGIANVRVTVPSGVVGDDKVTYACRTE